jgi:hypothetical protein
VQEKKQVSDGRKQADGYKEEVEYSVTHVSQSASNASVFVYNKFFLGCMVDSLPYDFRVS